MLLTDGDRFEVVNMRQRIFRRRPGAQRPRRTTAIPMKMRPGMGAELHAVARTRQLRDLILDAAPGADVALDEDGLVVMINSQARAQFGLTPA